MKRRIGILMLAAGRSAGGPDIYEREITRALAAEDRDTEFHLFGTTAATFESLGIEQENFIFHQLKPANRIISLMMTFPRICRELGIDFYHATFAPAPGRHTPYVFSHHCFSNFQHPEFYPWSVRLRLNALLKRGIRDARLVLCVSENVRELTVQKFDVDPARFRVIHHGVNPLFQARDADQCRAWARERFSIVDPYVIVVGKLEKRKNLERTLEAFARFRAEVNEPVKLVLVGKRTWHNDMLDAAIARHNLQQHVIETGYLHQEELNLLYSGALMCSFASLWEGFGMPILEAMASGTPLISSNLSSIPEVAGGAALLVDPYQVDEIAGAMKTLHADADLRKKMRLDGIARAGQFTWQKAARETLAAYREID